MIWVKWQVLADTGLWRICQRPSGLCGILCNIWLPDRYPARYPAHGARTRMHRLIR